MLNGHFITIHRSRFPRRVPFAANSDPDARIRQPLLREYGIEVTRSISLSQALPSFETLDVGAWVRELADETKHLAEHRSVVICSTRRRTFSISPAAV